MASWNHYLLRRFIRFKHKIYKTDVGTSLLNSLYCFAVKISITIVMYQQIIFGWIYKKEYHLLYYTITST